MDKIYINNLEFIAYHGVSQEEKSLGQKFLVSLEIFTETRRAGKSDKIEDTLNYSQIASDVEQNFTKKSLNLIEACAEDIAEFLLCKYQNINEIKIIIKKPSAPLKMHFDSVAVEVTRKRYEVYLSLGSNMGNREEKILSAIEEINKMGNTNVIKTSQIIEYEPFGFIEQAKFLNCVVKVSTLLIPQEFLKNILEIEKNLGRNRKNSKKWGPRIIDIDILLYGKEIVEDDNLSIPHLWMEKRAFVLEPLCEIAPNVIHPLLKKSIFRLNCELNGGYDDIKL